MPITSGAINSPDPSTQAAAVTPSDTVDLPFRSRALYIGVAGDVTAVMHNGDVILFKNLAAGTILPVRVARVNATNTTASSIVALY